MSFEIILEFLPLHFLTSLMMLCSRDVAKGEDLIVYRPDNSADRDLLMQARRCEGTYESFHAEVEK